MAAIHHSQIYREESGLCGCEFNSLTFFHIIFFIKDSQLTYWGVFIHLYVAGSAYRLWCWRRQISQRHRHPRVHLQHLHGWQVCAHLCANVSHHITNRCVFTYQTATKSLVTLWRSFPSALSLSLFVFARSRCFNNSDGDFLIGEEKGCWCFYCHLSQEQWWLNPQSFFSLKCSFLCFSLSVCLSSPPAGWDLDHHGVWENDGRAERDLCDPGEVYVFHLPSFHTEIYHCVCPHTPLTIFRKPSFGTFRVTLKVQNSGKRFEL